MALAMHGLANTFRSTQRTQAGDYRLSVGIGGTVVRLSTTDRSFSEMLADRYAGFLDTSAEPEFDLQVDLLPPDVEAEDADAHVSMVGNRWILERGDFRAEWDPVSRRGWVRQAASPYSIDSVLRILHTLLLARRGGFLVHAASAIRNGRAFIFAGRSEAGKTTISRLAPPDTTLLTDEMSYVCREGSVKNPAYRAFGTPFAGELAKAGENVSAPLAALYLLAKGPVNKIEPLGHDEAISALMQNILFFAHDREIVKLVFQSACEFVERVPISRLVFAPDARVWEMIV